MALDPLGGVVPHAPTLNHLTHAVAGPVVLCEPITADGAARAIAAWHVVDTYLRPSAQLVVLGATQWWPDARVAHLVRSLALANVWLHAPADLAVRAAFFASAAVYAVLDDGGIAGVPSASARGVPVVVAGELADAPVGSIVLPVGVGASLLAEALDEAMRGRSS